MRVIIVLVICSVVLMACFKDEAVTGTVIGVRVLVGGTESKGDPIAGAIGGSILGGVFGMSTVGAIAGATSELKKEIGELSGKVQGCRLEVKVGRNKLVFNAIKYRETECALLKVDDSVTLWKRDGIHYWKNLMVEEIAVL